MLMFRSNVSPYRGSSGPLEVPDDCFFSAHRAPQTRFLAMRAPQISQKSHRPTCANSGKYQSPLFLFSSETNGAIGHPIIMFMQPLPPHLVTRAASKSCSVCGHEFSANSQPLLRNVFEEHVRTMHIAKRPLPRSVHRRVDFIKNVA